MIDSRRFEETFDNLVCLALPRAVRKVIIEADKKTNMLDACYFKNRKMQITTSGQLVSGNLTHREELQHSPKNVFSNLLVGVHAPFVREKKQSFSRTDHQSMKWIFGLEGSTRQQVWWAFRSTKSDLELQHHSGRKNRSLMQYPECIQINRTFPTLTTICTHFQLPIPTL